MTYTSINIQGNIISGEILEKIRTEDIRYQAATDFNLEQSDSVRDEISLAWSLALSHWNAFKQKRERLEVTDSGTTETRNHWVKPLLALLQYDLSLDTAEEINGKSYAISFRATNLNSFPVHIVGLNQSLDRRPEAGGSAPHALVQEYLNNQEHLYALVSNGKFLRLLRDATRLSRLSYLEWNLEQMMEEQLFVEFALLYRVLHASRMPKERDGGADSIIEFYHQEALAAGSRIRDRLSKAVETSIRSLANGFLKYPANEGLRAAVIEGRLTAKDYYIYNLRVIYRILFLMVTEERNLIYPTSRDGELEQKRNIYYNYYSIQRLSKLVEKAIYIDPRKTDLWQSLLACFALFEDARNGAPLGIAPLGSGLFAPDALGMLHDQHLDNDSFLNLLRNLVTFENDNKQRVRVNYADLDVEELGSVYEGLLELHPVINAEQLRGSHFAAGEGPFVFHEGTERKTTGSYYTKPELVNQLIKSALIPVIEQRLNQHKNDKEAQAKALLKLKVCDPAAGSGHMLLAAARTIAWYLAKVQTGEDNPAPAAYRSCLREVIQHCVYAVDYNPAAVELCKLALWLEGHNSGKPLSFLDHKIRNGNSLVGVTDLSVLKEPIPDEAYNPVTGDDKKVCSELKKRNKAFKKTRQTNLFATQGLQIKRDREALRQDYEAIENIQQDTLEAVRQISERFTKARKSIFHEEKACHMWTAAFFKTYTEADDPSNPTSERLQGYSTAPTQYGRLVAEATLLAEKHKFFHWVLEFPDVFAQGGFDVMLGNPPWEKIKLEEQQFFATRVPAIAKARNKAARNKLIKQLPNSHPQFAAEYSQAVHDAESLSKFIRFSNRFLLSARGDINTYLLFTELAYKTKMKRLGRSGMIIPIGLVAESSSKDFFQELVNNNAIESFYGFVNTKKIFPSIKDYIKFGLITLGNSSSAKFSFWLTDVSQVGEQERTFSITKDEIALINPNTRTCPIFRTLKDAIITKKVFGRLRILDNDLQLLEDWHPVFNTLYHMSNDSGDFIEVQRDCYVPLYEAKMIWNFDHRFSTYENATESNINEGNLPQLTPEMHGDAKKAVATRYFVEQASLKQRIGTWGRNWFIAFRGIAATNNERTFIYSAIPFVGAGNSAPVIIFPEIIDALKTAAFLANANTLVYDYIGRQKAAGSNLNFFIVRQMPVLQPKDYNKELLQLILPSILELVYTSWDIKAFADDIWKEADEELRAAMRQQFNENRAATGGHEWAPPEWAAQPANPNTAGYEGCPLAPFKWDEERRAVLKAELDAIYAKLYGLSTEELRYILDPRDVYGPDFPGETFRVLKEKEIRLYGEYRTKRLVLEAWHRLNNEPQIISTTQFDAMPAYSLDEGLYTLDQAASITRFSTRQISTWFDELAKEGYEGLKTIKGERKISFYGLVELTVIGAMRQAGVKLKKILYARKVLAEKIASLTGVHKVYSFATNNVDGKLNVSGRDITFEFPDGEIMTLDGTSQLNLHLIKIFFADIKYDRAGFAEYLRPVSGNNLVIIDPKKGGGKPIIERTEAYTQIISNMAKRSYSWEQICEQCNVSSEEVAAALAYENREHDFLLRQESSN